MQYWFHRIFQSWCDGSKVDVIRRLADSDLRLRPERQCLHIWVRSSDRPTTFICGGIWPTERQPIDKL